jgi:hypothetical protein
MIKLNFGDMEGRGVLEDLGAVERIILKWILKG